MQWPYDPPFIPTTLIIPNNKQIVAEHAYFYPYYEPQLAETLQLDFWESIYDAAGGANTPTAPIINPNTATPGIGMPGIGGIEFSRALIESGRSIPTVFITASERTGLELQLARLNPVAVLHKPFTKERLIEALDRAVG